MAQEPTPESEPSWDQLEALLRRTREALQASDYRNLETALEEAGRLVTRLTASPPALTQERKERLLHGYRQLTLIGAAHRQAVRGQLRQIREGRRAMTTYGRQV